MELSQMGMTIKTEEETLATSTEYSASEINLDHVKQEHELVQSVKIEPAMLVKKEIVEYSSEDDSEQQCAQGPSALAGAVSLYEANSTSQGDWINVKPELEEMDIGPTVLQHMDIQYALNKSTVDGCSKAKRSSRGNEDQEDKLRDNKARSHNCNQTTTEVDNDDAHMKSHQGQQEDLKKHCTTTSKGFKCDKPQCRKQHLLSVQNYLHQLNSRKAMTTRGTAPSLSDQSADKGNKHYHCNAKFARSGDYSIKKIRVQKDEKPFRCKLCVSRFARNSDLTKHLGVHTGEKPYQCKMCDARFVQNGNLTAHMRIHTGEKPYQCKICSARFSQLAILTRHVRVHTGEKPYHCKICDARFKRNEYLTAHMIIHTGAKIYQCKMCDARFGQNSHLTKHLRVHTGEKPYQCKICDAGFKRNGNLTVHMKIHTGEKPYHCKICDARFKRNGNLTAHIKIHADTLSNIPLYANCKGPGSAGRSKS